MMKKYSLSIYCHTLNLEEEPACIPVGSLGLHPEMLERLVALGILEVRRGMVTPDQVRRLQKIFRLRGTLGVNLTGAAIIVDLLERMEKLEDELERLRRTFL